MKPPRFSLRAMAYAVLVATLDLAWCRLLVSGGSLLGLHFGTLDWPVLGLANVLAVAAYPLLDRREGRPFRVGFVGGGLLCSVVYVVEMRNRWGLARGLADLLAPVQSWFVPGRLRSTQAEFWARTWACLVAISLVGAIPLAALGVPFGLLARLATRDRPVPRWAALGVVVVLVGSLAWTVRRLNYRDQILRCEEICQVLLSEADAISKDLARARAGGPPEEVRGMVRELGLRERALAEIRRHEAGYRRAANWPWLSYER